ncbi:MAG: response regulator [Hyphomicrobiaceae bacterium]
MRSSDLATGASPRRRVLKSGTAIFNLRRSTLPCVVREISDDGAKLEVHQGLGLPDQFELRIDLEGLEVGCEVVWRKAYSVGVRFVRPLSPGTSTARAHRRDEHVGLPAPSARPNAADHVARSPERGNASSQGSSPVPPAEAAPSAPPIHILVADDDADDRMLLQSAFEAGKLASSFSFVGDGLELLRYLKKEPPFENAPMPGFVLLDLNMPKMDGRMALRHIRSNSAMRRLPIIILSDSDNESDIERAYELGVSGYFPKPGTLDDTMDLINTISLYWRRVAAPQRR